MEKTANHHVAWADRIGFNKQWSRDMESCSDNFATDTYHHMVRRFKLNIPNIKDGPELYNMITSYEKQLFNIDYYNILNKWKENNPDIADNESDVLQKEDEIRIALNEELYHFIVQLLENNGFGFYKSNVVEEEVSLNP